MNTNTKISTIACRAIGAALLLAVPAGTMASDEGDDIIVSPKSAMEQWQQGVTSELNRALVGGGVRHRGEPNNAIVQVTFSLGDDGKPDNVQLYNTEGNFVAERMAVRAVRRLNSIDEVPVQNPQDTQFLANIIFADNDRIHDRLEQRLEQSEAARIASTGEARTYIALRN